MNSLSATRFSKTTITLIGACLASIVFVDVPLAFAIDAHLGFLRAPLEWFTPIVEWLLGFPISKYLAGFILLAVAGILYLQSGKLSRPILVLLFIAGNHIVSRLMAGTLKNVFLRTRPSDILDSGLSSFWVSGGSSFPSGHATHVFGLFLPLMFLYPSKTRWLLVFPVFVALSRVLVNDHYLSDVLGSAIVCLVVTVGLASAMKIGNREKSPTMNPPRLTLTGER